MACMALGLATVLLAFGVVAAPALENAISMKIVGDWSVEVGPGTVRTEGGTVTLGASVALAVPPVETVVVRDERHDALPVFNPNTGGWCKGARLQRLIAEECTGTGLLLPDSVRVKVAPGEGAALVCDKDYAIDGFWATFGRIEGGALKPDQPVYVDYECVLCRLDRIAVDKAGRVALVLGTPGLGSMYPPEIGSDAIALGGVWLQGKIDRLSEDNLYPIDFAYRPKPVDSGIAARLLPKTLAKLERGEPVTIVAWGDSVTNGGGVGDKREQWYQEQFAARLRECFPKAAIDMRTAAWGGGNSKGYMDAPAGGVHDFVRDVLDPKPDLVTIEFVNDAYLDEAGVDAHYGKILEILRGAGAEVALIAPHLVRPDWMHSDTMKFDDDPRPYVRGLRRFAAEHDAALADASRLWCGLWRQGIPYITVEANCINHPDVRGHRMFADALMELFF